MAAAPQAGAAGESAEEEKSEFDVELVAPGDAKIAAIKIVREITGLMKHQAIIGPETENLCSLAEIFRNCSLFLGNDTGIKHY